MKIGLATVMFMAAVSVAVLVLVNAEQFRPLLETQLTTALGRQVKLGNLRLSLFTGNLVATDLSIADDPSYSTTLFIAAKQLRIGVEMKPLIFSRQLKVRSFAVVSPQVHLVRQENGTWNFSEIGRNAARHKEKAQQISGVSDLTVDQIIIEDGHAVVEDLPEAGSPRIFEHVNLSVSQFSFTKQFPFTLSASLPGNAEVAVAGNAGPIDQQDTSMTSLDVRMSMKHLDPVSAGLLDPNVGVSMSADIDAHAASDGQTLTSNGIIHMDHLQLRKGGSRTPNAVDLSYSVAQGRKDASGQIRDATVNVGNVAIHLSGTYQLRTQNPLLNLKMTGRKLPIDELQALLTAAGIKLPNGATLKGGTLDIAFVLTGLANALIITGPIEMNNTSMVGFDLGSRIRGIAALSRIKTGDTTSIENLQANLRITNSGTQINNIYARIPAMGEITGSGTVSPTTNVDFALTAKVTSAQGIGKIGAGILTKLNGTAGSGENGNAIKGVPMLVTGTASEPIITADVKGLFDRSKKGFLGHFGKKKS